MGVQVALSSSLGIRVGDGGEAVEVEVLGRKAQS